MDKKRPTWLDEIIVLTMGSKQKRMDELIDVLTRLKNAGYRRSEYKSELFNTEIEWIGHKIDQKGIRPLKNKLLAIKELKKPENKKDLKSFSGAIEYLSTNIEKLSKI